MKTTTPTTKEVTIDRIKITLPVNYGEEDIPNDFPMRKDDIWEATVEMDTGMILDWPTQTEPKELFMKVTDGGSYALIDDAGKVVASIEEDYVPNGVVPGEDGDYVHLEITADGVISNWPKRPNLGAFFRATED